MEFQLIFLVFPITVLVISIVGYSVTKKTYVTPAILFVLFTFLMLLLFNESFFIWVLLYTLLSVIVTMIMYLFGRIKRKRTK
ncbi:DUF2651 family protein [Metabacillus endolithicus]|uniref:DUF2651 family protein n=1 Tax=Metabacillus endolithicus TaxID=1535204 RepID=A0ABW5C425_9BACI|nr:DUF2651 family protein [Metabacillus endolithicus]UPG64999.1 YbeF family protein [Metabacillus endolithicus]